MNSILIVDSGSTKTDWVWLFEGKKKKAWTTSGINPMLQNESAIVATLNEELKWNVEKNPVDLIFYYGAGVSGESQKKTLTKILKSRFGKAKIDVQSDLVAAARGLCQHGTGVVCILGTGSNSGYYDGKKIKEKVTSLGYIVGDEGGGNHMGKFVLRYYAYGTFDQELKLAFEQRYGKDVSLLLKKIYNEPFPNRYLAQFVDLLKDFRGYYMVENIIEDSLVMFFSRNVLKYRQSWTMPIHFTGSIAYEFRDVIKNLCQQYELELGKIEKSPMKGLIEYHLGK